MAKLNIYQVGFDGINVVKSPLQMEESELAQSQNAELILDFDDGGIPSLTKRSGYINLGSSMGSSIAEMADIRFISSL